jgi:hypothetical protein
VLCGIAAAGSRSRQRSIEKTALGAETSCRGISADTATAVAAAAASGYHVAAIEARRRPSTSTSGHGLAGVLVFGHGVAPIWPAASRRVRIPMRAEAIAQRRHAAGVVLYELLRRRLYVEGGLKHVEGGL